MGLAKMVILVSVQHKLLLDGIGKTLNLIFHLAFTRIIP